MEGDYHVSLRSEKRMYGKRATDVERLWSVAGGFGEPKLVRLLWFQMSGGEVYR
jgi:hypothetical protein